MPINSNTLAFYLFGVLFGAGIASKVYWDTENRRAMKSFVTFSALVAMVTSITPLFMGHLIVSEQELLRNADRYTSYVSEQEASIPVRVRAAYVLSLYEIHASSTTEIARKLATGILLTAADEEAQKALRPIASSDVAKDPSVGENDLRRIAKLLQEPHATPN